MKLIDRVTADYYATTAGRTHEPAKSYYEANAARAVPWLRAWLPSHRSTPFLDLGCGCGEFLYLLESRGYTDLHGVDLCKEEVEFANQYCRANVQHGEVLDYLKKCPDNSFGAVSALNLLEHLEDDILLALLPEVRRVLRPGGVLLAMVPNAISPFSGTTRYWDITHRRAFTANNFRQLAALTGFRPNVEVRECGPFPHGAKSGIRYAMWQVLRLLVAAWFIVEVADAKGGVYTMDMIVRLERD